MSKRVIILNFPVESQAYQAFSEIKRLLTILMERINSK